MGDQRPRLTPINSARAAQSPSSMVLRFSPSCIVRTVMDKLAIEVNLAGSQRTLSRPQEEQLERSLFRLAAAAGGKRGPPPATRLLDASGLPLAPDTRAIDAWSSAALLEVGDDEQQFAVLFDPPEVEALELPWAPLVGVPLLPRVSCRCCQPDEVDVHWERRAGEAEWQTIARGLRYVPTAEDVGCELRLTATPPAPASLVANAAAAAAASLTIGTSSATDTPSPPPPPAAAAPPCLEALRQQLLLEPTAASLPRPHLRERIAALEAARASRVGDTDGGGFRVLSYNLLADAHRHRWDDPRDGIHTYCAPALTAAARRLPRLLEEVLAFRADVLCLQEVDRNWWEVFWRPQLEDAGFSAHFSNKRNKDSQEGVAVAVRTSALELLELREMPLSLRSPPALLAPLLAAQPGTAAGVAALPSVGQLVLLREARGARRQLLLAHTHLYFANPAVHVRLLQTAALLHAATAWREELSAAGGAAAGVPPPALLFAGDLNSDATDGALHLLLRGGVPADHRDWLLGRLTWAPSTGLDESARRAARSAAARARTAAAQAELDPANDDGGGDEDDNLRAGEAVAAADAAIAAASSSTLAEAEAPILTIAEAEARALEWQRLRKALQQLHRAPTAAVASLLQADADAAARGALVVAAAAAGRSLLDSPVLAAAEVARQMRLEQMRRPTAGPTTGLAAESAVAGGAPAAAAVEPSLAWLLSAVGREACLVRMARLDADLARLTTRGPAPVDDEEAAVEAETAPLPTVPLAAAVGTRLSVAPPLRSAYGVHTRPTHATPGYLNALDWVLFEPGPLRLVGVAPLPPVSELLRDTALPSAEYPSDHVSLCADLEWSGEGA